MKTHIAIALLAGSTLLGQSTVPGWKEFSIGAPTSNHSSFSRFGFRAEGVPLKRALAKAFGVEENRIEGPGWLADERYAITAIVADSKDFQKQFQQELANQFHMATHKESRVVPVFMLRRLDGPAKLSAPSGPSGGSKKAGDGQTTSITMPHATLAAFADSLANAISRSVIDETNMDGSFDFNLSWKAGSNGALQEAVKDQLGLQLIDERRPVDMVVIDHIEKLQFQK